MFAKHRKDGHSLSTSLCVGTVGIGLKGSRRRPTMQRRIDMWDLGTVMAELVDLAPMLPGTGEIDQVALIIELPSGPPSEF